jgi:hypothetical protein
MSESQSSMFDILQCVTLIGPSQNSNISNDLQIEALFATHYSRKGSFCSAIYNTSPHIWAKDMGQIGTLLCECFLSTLLGASWVHVDPPHCLSRVFICNFIYLCFYLGISKSQHSLLWFKVISLISCDASQSLFILQWLILISPSTKRNLKLWAATLPTK